MLNLIFYILTVSYLTKLLLLDHQHYFFDRNYTVTVHTHDGDLIRIWDVGDTLRSKLLKYHMNEFNIEVPYTGLTQLFLCPYCLGFWVNLILLPLLIASGTYSPLLITLFIFGIPFVVGKLND